MLFFEMQENADTNVMEQRKGAQGVTDMEIRFDSQKEKEKFLTLLEASKYCPGDFGWKERDDGKCRECWLDSWKEKKKN